MKRIFIEFADDITVEQVTKALKKLDPGVVAVVAKSVRVEHDRFGDFEIRKKPSDGEAAIRRIIRDEISRMR